MTRFARDLVTGPGRADMTTLGPLAGIFAVAVTAAAMTGDVIKTFGVA
jgi:hypothetical protein